MIELDRLGYRYRFSLYPAENHLLYALRDKFEDAVAELGTSPRKSDPGHITFAWYPRLVRADLGIGPHRVWWVSDLIATQEATERGGAVAEVDARSFARPSPHRTAERRGEILPDLFDPSPGVAVEQTWAAGTDARARAAALATRPLCRLPDTRPGSRRLPRGVRRAGSRL